MKPGINVKYLARETSLDEALEIVKNAGFDVLDFTPSLREDDWESQMHKEFELIVKHALTVHQTHAPYNRYGGWDDNFKLCLNRALDAAIFMGAKYMVIHGDEFDFDNMEYSHKAALEYNYRLFYPLVEKAASNNVKLAFENVFEDNPKKPRFCSDAEDLLALIEKYNSDAVCCCWDTGHAAVRYWEKQSEKILLLGKHIECTHIHDNNFYSDSHSPLFCGKINWKECMDAFKKVGYSGNFTYEMVYGNVPKELAADFAAYLKKCADIVCSC